MKQLTKDDILSFLRREKTFMENEFGVLSIGLFGSYAKDTQIPESDVDLLVEFSRPTFDNYAGLQIFLESVFDRKIELIRKRKDLSRRFMSRIEKDIHYA